MLLRAYDSILDMLSSVENPTPIVRLLHVTPYKHTQVFAKLEWYNPFGAVKDRVAANLVRDAEERGEKLEHLVEPTSGNTGMGLAMLSNAKGYKFAATMSKEIPAEKRAVLRFFGTDLYELEDTLCPMPGQPEGAMAKATELAARPGWKQLNQYKNPANPDAHFRTTGPEVWKQTRGKITHFVASLGTCGTITGDGTIPQGAKPEREGHWRAPDRGSRHPGRAQPQGFANSLTSSSPKSTTAWSRSATKRRTGSVFASIERRASSPARVVGWPWRARSAPSPTSRATWSS